MIEIKKNTWIDGFIFGIALLAFFIIAIGSKSETYYFLNLRPSLRQDAYSGLHVDYHTIFRAKLLFLFTGLVVFLFSFKMLISRCKFYLRIEYILAVLMIFLYLLSSSLTPEWFGTMLGFDDIRQGFLSVICYILLFIMVASVRIDIEYYSWHVVIVNLIAVINLYFLLTKHGISTLFGNVNYSSGFMASVFMVDFYCFFVTKKNINRMMYLIFAIISLIGVYYSLSFSGFLTIVVFIPIVVICLYLNSPLTRSKTLLKIFTIITLIAIVSGGAAVFFNKTIRSTAMKILSIESNVDLSKRKIVLFYEENFGFPVQNGNTNLNRLGIWQETTKLILEKPWIGHGADTLYYYFPNKSLSAYQKITNVANGGIVTKPHNYFLSIAFDAGIFALISFLAILAVIIKRMLRSFKNMDDESKITSSCLSVFVMCMLFQAVFNDLTIVTATMFWISLGLWMGLLHQNEDTYN